MESVAIPDSVVDLQGSAFRNCTSLTSATLSHGITIIPIWAFSGYVSLESVTILGSVTTIREEAFLGAKNVKKLTFEGEWLPVIQRNAFKLNDSPETLRCHLNLPASVNRLPDGFKGYEYTEFYSEITWVGAGGTYDPMEVTCGSVPEFDGDVGKPGDGEGAYVLTGWDPEPKEVTRDATYTAVYAREAAVGSKVAAPEPGPRDGYEFKGWASEEGGPAEYVAGQSFTAVGDMTLYAVWAPAGAGDGGSLQWLFSFVVAVNVMVATAAYLLTRWE